MNIIRILYFFYFAAYGIFTVYITLYYRQVGLNGTQIGWINTMAPLVGIFSGALWGFLNDRFGRIRLLLQLAAAGSALALIAIGQVQAFLWIVLLVGAFSLFNTPMPPLLDNLNLGLLGARRELYGRQRIWGSLGFVVTTSVFGFVLQRMGLNWIFVGFAVIMAIFWLVALKLPEQRVHLRQSFLGGISELVRQPRWLLFAASVLLLWMASSGMYGFLTLYLNRMGATESLIGLAWSTGALAEMPIMYFSGSIVRKFGPERLLFVSYFAYAVRTLLYGLMPAPYWAVPIALLHSFSFGLFWISSVNYVNDLAPAHLKATSQGLLLSLLSLANVLGSPLGGMLYDRIGPANLFRIYALFCLAALGLFWIGTRWLGRHAL